MLSLKKYLNWQVTLLMVSILMFSFFLFELLFFSETISDPKESIPTIEINTNQKSQVKSGLVSSEGNNRGYSPLTTETIWKKLLASFQKGGKMQIGIEKELIERLRKEQNSPIYDELLGLFRRGQLAKFPQQILVSMLGEVGNHRSAETLMSLISESLLKDPDVRFSTARAINKFSPESWRTSNPALASVFETGWQTDNSEFWPSIANVMASIGSPSTLDIFTKVLTDNTEPKRIEIVKQAMTNLTNPALIPKLADSLENPKNEIVQLASGDALANMGTIDAASTLLDWSLQADAEKADLVKTWFYTTMNTTPEFINYLEINLSKRKFESPDIKQAIQESLNDVKVQLF